MGWEVEGLKINVNDIVTIAKDYPVSYMTISVENLAEQYDYDAKIDQRAFMNTNANTHIIGTGSNANFNNAYRYVFGWTLPTDKTIYIQTDQNDGNVWFWWDGINIGGGSSFGNNSQYFRGISFPVYNDRGFNYSGSAINCYSTLTSKTIGDKIYYSQSTLGSRDTPYLYTTIPLSNFVINGERYDSNKSGGAGSGYIGNSLLSNKKMVGYNVPTSSAESTKTESVNEASETPVSGKPKIGNGFARIKFLREITDFVLIDSYNNYHSPIVDLSNTGWKDGNQTTRWQYLQDGTFESFDDSQAQAKCVFNTKMKKGSAVNLCIECTTENVYAYPDFGFGLMSTMPTEWGYPSGGNRGTVLKWLYDFANTTKGTYKMSLSDISADAEFYLCFYNNSTKNIVYKVWFEGIPVFVS